VLVKISAVCELQKEATQAAAARKKTHMWRMRAAYGKKQAAHHREEHSHPRPDGRQASNQQRWAYNRSKSKEAKLLEMKRGFQGSDDVLAQRGKQQSHQGKQQGHLLHVNELNEKLRSPLPGVEFPPLGAAGAALKCNVLGKNWFSKKREKGP
jgi:hypothetical protein